MRLSMVVFTAALLAACSGTEPAQPIRIELISGDGQTAPRGTALANPIIVRVIGEGEVPFVGAIVSFTVNGINIAFDTSDAAGEARLNWTLPANATGSVSLSAGVAGITPVVVGATSLDPCLIDNDYVYGAAGNGILTEVDCVELGAFIDYYGFVFPGGAGEFLMNAAFDTWIQMEDAAGNIVAINDDIATGVNVNSRAKVFLVDGTDYRFGATSFGAFVIGTYDISSGTTSTDVTNCEEVWIVRGVQTSQSLTNIDCDDGSNFMDAFLLVIPANASATVRMSSNAVDPFLRILSASDTTVLSDDNSGGGTEARVVITAISTSARLFQIQAGAGVVGGLGAYTLNVIDGTAGAAPLVPADSRELRRQLRQLRERSPVLQRRQPAGVPEKAGGSRASGRPGW